MLDRIKRSRQDFNNTTVKIPKMNTGVIDLLACQGKESLLKRRKQSADAITTGDNLHENSTPSGDKHIREISHRNEVADLAEQRKILEENRGIGDRRKVERMQKRSRDNEVTEAGMRSGAKQLRLMEQANNKRENGVMDVPDVRPAVSRQPVFPPEGLVEQR